MKKGRLPLCAAVALVLLLNGCAGYTEIENMDILTSHFVYQRGDQVQIGGGVANVRSLSDSMASDPVNMLSAEGGNLHDAVSALQRSADHKLFYGGMRAIVIGSSYAVNGIGEFARYIRSTPEQRMSVDVFTSENEPQEIVKYKAVNDFSGGFSAESIMRTLESENLAPRCTLGDVLAALAEEQVGFAVPNIAIEDEIMRINGYSIFSGETKIAFLGAEQISPLGFFVSPHGKGRYYADAGGRTVTVEAQMTQKTVHVEESVDGQLSVAASFTFDMAVSDIGSAGLSQQETEAVKVGVAQQIAQSAESLLALSKNYGCDFLGLYKIYQTKHRARFYTIDWPDKIRNMQYAVDVQAGTFENNLTNEELWR